MNEKIYDITIIGGGPTGLFTAFYGGLRNASVKVIESLTQLGGQLSAIYPEKNIYDVAGFPKIKAQQLIDDLEKQAMKFNPTICLGEKVLSVKKKDECLFEMTTQKTTHWTRAIIITAGNGSFEPRKLKIEGLEKYEGNNLHYFVNDLNAFKDHNVIVAGGGDSAVDWALMLEPIANQVKLVHRRDKFRAHEYSVETLMKSSVEIVTPVEISGFQGGKKITHVFLQNKKTQESYALEADDLLVNYGFVSSLGSIADWGLNIERGNIVVNAKMETNIPGIYAAGDITTYQGKVKLIAVGFGEAPIAVNHAKQYIDPEARLQPGHSSNMQF